MRQPSRRVTPSIDCTESQLQYRLRHKVVRNSLPDCLTSIFLETASGADVVVAVATRRAYLKDLGAHVAMTTIIISRPSTVAGPLTRKALSASVGKWIGVGEVRRVTRHV